jgi:hypothetical protein
LNVNKSGYLALVGVLAGAGQAYLPALVRFQPPLLSVVCCLLSAVCCLMPDLLCLSLLDTSSPCHLLFLLLLQFKLGRARVATRAGILRSLLLYSVTPSTFILQFLILFPSHGHCFHLLLSFLAGLL